MCSVLLSIGAGGVFAGANRDEMANRPWEPPAEYWPGICGGRDSLARGTWLALNKHGVMAAVLNREGTLGPAPGKESRGRLPLRALRHETAEAAAKAIAALDAGSYRAFNLVLADAHGAFFIRGLGAGQPEILRLTPGVHMITAGEPDDITRPRIARHLPRFAAAPFAQWGTLLADTAGERAEQLNVKPEQNNGFGTICASLVSLPRAGLSKHKHTEHKFAAGAPDSAAFRKLEWNTDDGADDRAGNGA